jgi:ABC-type glutathione transport system ATPase component
VGFQLEEVVRLHRGLGRREARIATIELLRSASVDEPEGLLRAWPHQISGGQAQRIALALALAGEPAVLLADEPTSGLDGPTANRLLEALDHACDVHGTALVIVSHDLAVVARCARHVVVMLDGRVVEQGPTKQMLTDARHPYTQRLIAAFSDPGDVPAGGLRGPTP